MREPRGASFETRPVGAPQDEVEAFETGSKLREIFFGPHRKKKSASPTWGMRAGHFKAIIGPRLGRRANPTLFRHAKRLAGNSGTASCNVV